MSPAARAPAEEKTYCGCADSFNAIEPDRPRCLIVCGAEVEKKWRICRPCAKGNHTGQPCRQFVREPIWHLMKTCAECGFDSALHEKGSDGRG